MLHQLYEKWQSNGASLTDSPSHINHSIKKVCLGGKQICEIWSVKQQKSFSLLNVTVKRVPRMEKICSRATTGPLVIFSCLINFQQDSGCVKAVLTTTMSMCPLGSTFGCIYSLHFCCLCAPGVWLCHVYCCHALLQCVVTVSLRHDMHLFSASTLRLNKFPASAVIEFFTVD